MKANGRAAFVLGATGFVGSELLPALTAAGWQVCASTRSAKPRADGVTWVRADLDDERSLVEGMQGCQAAYFLVHGLARPGDYARWEREGAVRFRSAAEAAGVERIVYLGGLAPAGAPSRHLESRLEVGQILRGGKVPCVELRSSMIVGTRSASWQIARDLAVRLPLMVVPRWVRSRTQPVAIEDIVAALVAAIDPGVPAPAVYDLPGPEVVRVSELLRRIAAQRGLRPLMVGVPVLTPRLSAYWLLLVTRANYRIARELVQGLSSDVLARDAEAWRTLGHTGLVPLDEAIARALRGGRLPYPPRPKPQQEHPLRERRAPGVGA